MPIRHLAKELLQLVKSKLVKKQDKS